MYSVLRGNEFFFCSFLKTFLDNIDNVWRWHHIHFHTRYDLRRNNTLLPLFIRGQFHQHFMHSFYARRSQKRKKTQLKQLFAILGSAGIKASRKHIDEIDPWTLFSGQAVDCIFTQRCIINRESFRFILNRLIGAG